MQSNDRHRVYKSLETDAEFRERLREYYLPAWIHEEALDEYVWNAYQKQRRMIERTTEKSTSPA